MSFEELHTLKLLTCAAMCYADIMEMLENKMKNSPDIYEVYLKAPQVQGTTLRWALSDLAKSGLSPNSITSFDDILNKMPNYRKYLERYLEQFKDKK